MTEQTSESLDEERVLILTPTGADGAVASRLLREFRIGYKLCSDLQSLCHQLRVGAGTAIIAQEALSSEEVRFLLDYLCGQPTWSDISIIILTTSGDSGYSTERITKLFGQVGNIVLLERPFQTATLISSIHAALRARRRQYEVRNLLENERAAKKQLAIAAQALTHSEQKLRNVLSDRERLLDSERSARLNAERIGRLKDEFLATLSHELRTPLNAISGWVQLLLRTGPEGKDFHRGLEVIEKNARTQTQLIEDLLDMSSIISGKVRLDVRAIDIVEVVESVIASVQPSADASDVIIIRDGAVDSELLLGDSSRIKQIIWNLLTNAVKFTPRHGEIYVSLKRLESKLEIKVRDTGKGIKLEFLPFVFERFRQEDASTTRKFGGMGIGLSLVKNLTEMHGGSVSVSSEGEGKGSVFTVTLPIAAVAVNTPYSRTYQGTTNEKTKIFEPPDLKGIKVLVVDDDEDAREVVSRILLESGATISTASSARDALAALQSEHPNILVSDIGMPEQDGYELMRNIRLLPSEKGGETPSIALTAFASPQDKSMALAAGYHSHLSKPVDPAEFLALVKVVVDSRAQAQVFA